MVSNASSELLGGSILDGLIQTVPKLRITDEPTTIPVNRIHTWDEQPRQYFSDESVAQLTSSFLKFGFKGTLTVRPHPTINNEYQLIAGERRYRAAKSAGLENVLCFVGEFTDEQALDFALGENLHREDLSRLEETNGILTLIQTRYSLEPEITIEIVNSQGRTSGSNVTPDESNDELNNIITVLNEYGIQLQTFRTSHLPTLKLQEILKTAHLEKGLSFLAAKALNQIKDEEILSQLLDQVLSQNMAVRAVRELVRSALADKNSSQVEPDSNAKSENSIIELKTVVGQITKMKKIIEADPEKMKKIKRVLSQLKSLTEED